MNLNFELFDNIDQIFSIWFFWSYVTIESFTMAHTVYHTYDHNTHRPKKIPAFLQPVNPIFEAPTEMLGVV